MLLGPHQVATANLAFDGEDRVSDDLGPSWPWGRRLQDFLEFATAPKPASDGHAPAPGELIQGI